MLPNAPRILLVDDDPDQAQLFALILSADGHHVVTAADAASALARLVAEDFALALVDWDLPGTKGDALITRIKAQYPDIRTVLFSNHHHVDDAAAACGADAWFFKMDNTARLRRIIAEQFARVREPA